MRRVSRIPRWVALLSGVTLALNVAACGDDDDDPPRPDAMVLEPDANVPDAGPPADAPAPDAPGPDAAVSTRSGVISVSEVSVPQAGGSGASVLVEYTDTMTGTVEAPAYYDIDDSGLVPIGCVVFVHDVATYVKPTVTDENPATIAGTLSPLPAACTFNTTANAYLCAFGGGAIPAGTSTFCGGGVPDPNPLCDTVPAGAAVVTISGATFDMATQSEAGMFISIASGFSAPMLGAFPIIQVVSPTTLLIANPAAANMVGAAGAAGAFAVIAGAGPTPANRNFLGDKDHEVTISKAASDEVEAIAATTLKAAGQASLGGTGPFVLDSASHLPHAFPTDGTAVTFSCANAGGATGGDCGEKPLGLLVTIINGNTTDTAVTGLPGFVMPPATTKFADFRCSFVTDDVTIPTGAMAAILGDATGFEYTPTRVQMRVFKFNGNIAANADGTNETTMVVGHGRVGFVQPAP